jgi:hypothetical protein
MSPSEKVWITMSECKALFGKFNRSVEYAIDKDKIKARQCTVGSTWLIEYNSCVSFWGQPIKPMLAEKIIHDITNA